MVLDEVWTLTGLGPRDGVLCLADLERRLGRPLRSADFMLPSNENRDAWDGHERMYPLCWPRAEPAQPTLPLRLPEQPRLHDPVPEALVRQFLRWAKRRHR